MFGLAVRLRKIFNNVKTGLRANFLSTTATFILTGSYCVKIVFQDRATSLSIETLLLLYFFSYKKSL